LEPFLCIDGLYSSGCSFGDGLVYWDFANINIPEIECANGDPHDWYHDFMEQEHLLATGSVNLLNVKAGYNDNYFDVWIDFNDDLYYDSTELILDDAFCALANTEYQFQIFIPDSVPMGAHLMRFRTNWQELVEEPCEMYSYGNCCDFTANIIPGSGDAWLTAYPLSGVITTQGTDSLTLLFNSMDMLPGEYLAELLINNNSWNDPELEVPVTFTVFETIEEPEIAIAPEFIIQELLPDNSANQSMIISNIGNSDLSYDITLNFTNTTPTPLQINTEGNQTALPEHLTKERSTGLSEAAPGIYPGPIQYSDDTYDLQFEYPCADQTGEAGIETDGNFIYTSLWNGNEFCKYEIDGTYVEKFSCGSAAAIRDLAYDGTYFYGAAANTTVFQMDFNTQEVLSTINAPIAVRAIAYDVGEDGFWANNWSDSPTLFDRSGATQNSFSIGGDESFYGFAWMDNELGMGLWAYSQKTFTSQNMLYLYNVSSGSIVEEFDMLTILNLPTPGVDIAGGLYFSYAFYGGYATLGGLVQNVCMWGIEMGAGYTFFDVGVSQIIEPGSGIDLTSSEEIRIEIFNNSNVTLYDDIPYTVSWDNGYYEGNAEGPIQIGQVIEVLLPVTADLSVYGDYTFEACAYVDNDMVPSNDCKTKIVSNELSWLTVSPLSGVVTAQGTDTITLDFNSMGLLPGEYLAELIINNNSWNAPELEVPVTFTVFEIIEDPVIAVFPDSLEFEVFAGSTASELISVSNIGTDVLEFEMTVEYLDSEKDSWLLVPSGPFYLNEAETIETEVMVDASDLEAGVYQANINIASNDPLTPVFIVAVSLTVLENIQYPEILVNPDFFEFELYPDSTTWGTMQIGNFGVGMLDYTLSVEYLDGAGQEKDSWIGIGTISGSVSAGEITELEFQVSALGLEAGDYFANILVASNDPVTPLVTIPVSLTVIDGCPLPPPTNLAAEEIEPFTVFLTWDEPEDDFLFYNVYRDATMLATELQISQYIDENVPAGNPEYVVSAVYDECEAFSDTLSDFIVTSIKSLSSQEIKLYPNPATDILNIESICSILKIEISNNLGQVVYHKITDTKTIQINTSLFSKGIYFVEIETSEGVVIEKLVIE
jgi:hypothetical protein